MRIDTMLEIKKQINLFSNAYKLNDELTNIVNEIKEKEINKVLIVGCGDSFFAGLSVKNLISKELKATCLPMTALEFEAYSIELIDKKTLVIAISMSGNVARTISGVLKAQEKGAFVIGMTNSKKGKLFNIAKYPFFLGLDEEEGWTPGTLTYTGTVFYLVNFVIQYMSEKKKYDYINSIEVINTFLDKEFEQIRNKAIEVSQNLALGQSVFPAYILGGGPNYATAKYSAAKFLELCDEIVIGQETEEFSHQEFWIINKNSPVFLLAQSGSSIERAYEVGQALRYYGIDLVSVSDDERLEQFSKYFFRMPKGVSDFITPLFYQLPLQLVSYYYSKSKGFDPDNRTHMDPFRKKVSRLLTRGNKNAGY